MIVLSILQSASGKKKLKKEKTKKKKKRERANLWKKSQSKSGVMDEKQSDKPLEFATEEFFERYVNRLFDLIDGDASAGGMPDGVLEIGSAILRKLAESPKLRHDAEIAILFRWFFCHYLPCALVFPEVGSFSFFFFF